MNIISRPRFFLSPTLQNFPGRKIVMLHIGRTGSTVLTNMLHEYAQIGWKGEAFRRTKTAHLKNERQLLFQAIREMRVNRAATHAGFEIKPMHLEGFNLGIPEFIAYCQEIGIDTFITLTRKNLLRKMVSSDMGKAAGKFQLGLHETIQKPKLSLCANKEGSILKRIKKYEQEVLDIESIKVPHLTLNYEEDVLGNIQQGFEKIQNYLSIPRMKVAVSLQRMNPEPLNEILANFKEVESVLKNTPYQWMLYE